VYPRVYWIPGIPGKPGVALEYTGYLEYQRNLVYPRVYWIPGIPYKPGVS